MKFAEMQVQYVDHMGSDINVVNAARCSFAKEVKEFDLEKDTKLINYLAEHNHWSPLAHTSITIRVKAPIVLARQFVKHQVGLVWNEESRRYIDSEVEFYTPSSWRGRAENAKQGSSDKIIDPVIKSHGWMTDPLTLACEETLRCYYSLLDQGVAPEQARFVLPQCTMTNWVWTGSLVAFARVCKLRLDPHAQKEAEELAQRIYDVVEPLYPVSWKSLMKHMKV